MTRLENEQLVIEIADHGAELKSLKLKETNQEYMWKADPQYWGRTSPILFPFVGSVYHGEYHINEKTYAMGQHGFARDMDFTLIEKNEDSVWFALHSNEETIAKYPYQFILQIGYQLHGRCVKVMWRVENTGVEEMPFAIGGHPAFNCPLDGGDSKVGCYLKFDTNASINSSRVEEATLSEKKDSYELENGFLKITKELFDFDALVLENGQIHEVSLCDKDKTPYLTVRAKAPLFGIWSPTKKDAPFVCIEPWYGRCDKTGFTGDLKHREWENLLMPGATWQTEYDIIIN